MTAEQQQDDQTGAMTAEQVIMAYIRRGFTTTSPAKDIVDALAAAGYHIAAGPTKAEVLAAVSHQLSKRGYVKLDGNIAYCEIHEALTALWPDGEHQGDTVTISRDRIPAIEPDPMCLSDEDMRDEWNELRSFVRSLATARPHQADPQEGV